jgi:uncharacterized membrane protein YczE
MRVPPIVRGGLGARLCVLVTGLFLCASGIVAFLEAELGLPPWDVLHQGLAEQTPLSFGAANVAVSVVVLAASALLGARIGLGTVLNALLIGTFVIGLTAIEAVDELSDSALGGRVVLMSAALALFGVGSALYIGADLGAGPRDSLMVVASRRLDVRLGVSRTAIELVALVAGVVLGGTVGVGTLVYALAIGPLAHVFVPAFTVAVATPGGDVQRAGTAPPA